MCCVAPESANQSRILRAAYHAAAGNAESLRDDGAGLVSSLYNSGSDVAES